jgi:hypothetical protein
MVDIWQDRPAGSPYQLDRTAMPTFLSEISGLVVLIVTVGYVDVVPCRWSSCYSRIAGVTFSCDCCSGPRQRTMRTAMPEEPCARPRRNAPGPSSAGRHQVYRSPAAGARPSRARIERSGDVALTARMLWTGGASPRGRFCRMSDVLGDKAEGLSIRFCALRHSKSPAAPFTSPWGATRTEKVWRWCCAG